MQFVSRAITFSKPGPPSQVLKVKKIALNATPHNMIIKILAAPVNPSDINMIEGTYPIKPKWRVMEPHPINLGVDFRNEEIGGKDDPDEFAVAGLEGVGQVIDIGAAFKEKYGEAFKVGDWVVPINQAFNTWQTHALVNDPKQCFKLENHEGISPISAATMSVNPPTALRMLKDFVKLEKGDVVLQNAANSAVGQAVIQISKAYGYKTVNIIRDRPDASNLIDALYDMGADLVITESQVRSDETTEKISSLSQSSPKLAFNGVGGKSATNLARLLGDHGQLITYGGMSRNPITLPTSLFIFKRLQAKGFWLSKWFLENPSREDRQEIYQELFNLMRKGSLREPIHQKWSWASMDDKTICNIGNFASTNSSSLPFFSTGKRILVP